MFSVCAASAQTGKPDAGIAEGFGNVTDTLSFIDSVIHSRPSNQNDSLSGRNIFSILNDAGPGTGSVSVSQSDSLFAAMLYYMDNNRHRELHGYRLRIFINNNQTARHDSEKVEKEFILKYPGCPTYRSYSNPYFKVAVGDFRTRSEAMKALQVIKKDYPAAFIVREPILPVE